MQVIKRFHVFLLIMGTLFSFNALAKSPVYELTVNGMSCPFCAYGVEKKLKSIKGVEQVEVNIGKGTVNVKMKPDITLKKEQAQEAVKEAGFSLKDFKQIPGE